MPESQGQSPEQPKSAYSFAAQFQDEAVSETAYFDAQQIIYGDENCDLSVFRFLNIPDGSWYVAVIGKPPSKITQENLQSKLGGGRVAQLPPEIIQGLTQRREQQTHLGPWVEKHYRPSEHRSNRGDKRRQSNRRKRK